MRAKGTGKIAPPEVKTPEMEAQATESEATDLDSNEPDEVTDIDTQDALLAQLEAELDESELEEAPIINTPPKTKLLREVKGKQLPVKKVESGDDNSIAKLETRLNELKAEKLGSGPEAKKIRRALRQAGIYVSRLGIEPNEPSEAVA